MPIYLIIRIYNYILKQLKDENYDDIIDACTSAINSTEYATLQNQYKLEILLLRASFYLLLGKHSSAFEDLDVIIKSKDAPKNVILNALIKEATLYMQLEDPDKAMKSFEAAIELDETYGDIYHHSGQVLHTEYIC